MKIFDSIKDKKWIGKNFDIKNETILLLKSSQISNSFLIRAGKFKLKILGKKRTGNGNLKIEILSDDNEIFLSEDINFNNSTWKEFTFTFDSKIYIGNSVIKLTREKDVYGSVELGRIFIDFEDAEKKNTEISRASGKRFVKKMEIKTNIKNNIAFIIPYGIYGGAEVYLERFINKIPNEYSITILYLQKNKLKNYLNKENIIHREIKNIDHLETTVKNIKFDSIIYYNRLDVYEKLNDLKIKKILKSRLIEIYHSDFIWSGALSTLKERQSVDRLIVVSKSLGLDINGFTEKQRKVIPVSLDLEYFSNSRKKNNLILGTVARLSKEKNINYIVDLAQQLKEYKFIIVGEGPEEKSIKERIQKFSLDNIELVGFSKDLYKYYNLFDGFILPSKFEGTPISILEAMAMEIPIFCNNVGAISDIVKDADTGFFMSGNSKKDADLIRENISNSLVVKRAKNMIQENHDLNLNYKIFLDTILGKIEQNTILLEPDMKILKGEYI